jgi:hypothetical protein
MAVYKSKHRARDQDSVAGSQEENPSPAVGALDLKLALSPAFGHRDFSGVRVTSERKQL